MYVCKQNIYNEKEEKSEKGVSRLSNWILSVCLSLCLSVH